MARLAGVLTLLVLLFVGAPVLAAPTFPTLTGRVVDDAHVLSPQTQADLTAKLAALEQTNSRQLVVVTLPTLGGDEIDDYGYRLLRAWGIGQKGTNNGAVFIVVPSEHKVRVEVGYGLEGVLTDALSSVILQRAVLPKFRAGDVQGGIVDGTNALIEQLSVDPSTAETKAAQAAAAVQRPERHGSLFGAILPIIFLIFIGSSLLGRGRGRGGGLGWLLPMMILGSGRRGWGDGGGGGDWGGGGGGFGGGGGSGGGGGASGSW
jgi:uncharacterized protein